MGSESDRNVICCGRWLQDCRRLAAACGSDRSLDATAEGFAQAARVADAVEARRVVDEQDHAERDADRARAAAQADAGTAWRAAAEAGGDAACSLGGADGAPRRCLATSCVRTDMRC